MMIEDLYERIPRFRILCRINHIVNFTSKKGNACTKIMLVDEKGNELACMPYEKNSEGSQKDKPPLLKGRAYIFESGSIEQDDQGYLSLSIPWSAIQETKLVLQSFHPGKMMRVGQL